MAARSACGVFSCCRCLVVGLVFSRLGFWGGGLFLIAPFPDLCLLVLFYTYTETKYTHPDTGLTRNMAMNIYNSTVDVFKIVHINSALFCSWKISENYTFLSC